MTKARRQAWVDYASSLGVAALMSVFMMPFLPKLTTMNPVIVGGFAAFVFGSTFYTLGSITQKVRMPTFWLNVIVRTLLTTLTIYVSFFLMAYGIAVSQYPTHALDPEMFRQLTRLVMSSQQWPFALAALAVSGVINFGFQINRKLGPGILMNWMTGKYYTPREEERIFMFLDMKDSTTIAEQLGTIKFSALVRDFFADLTYPVLETRAAVSHYIGDEAVIYWVPKDGLADANCLRLFFKMRQAIDARGDYYRAKYGFVPEFKAGVHIGPVVATEVGELKSEIVFHGDTLNTAARIQGLCGELGSFLISQTVAARLPETPDFLVDSLGAQALKGKAQGVEVFAVAERLFT